MVFSNLIFIYIFLPLNLLLCALIRETKYKNICMLVFSLAFYAWSSPKYLVLLILMAFINYIAASKIQAFADRWESKVILIADLAITLGLLGYFKYFGFLCSMIDSVVNIFDVIPNVVLPVGISFYTFQLISYVTDVYRKDVEADKSFVNVLLYASLFHQCIAGPIVRYKDIAKELKQRSAGIDQVSDGISRFCVGLAKKVILADTCNDILKTLLPDTITAGANLTVAAAWVGCIIYMLQIYLDFSAYSDMAIGLGKMTGLHYKENFNYPYLSKSVTEFWRRWHMSLSTFFRDYVYIPLGGNRKGLARQLVNMLVVWALTGLWHGAGYSFVLWGLYYFVFLVLEKVFLLKIFKKLPHIIATFVSRVYTLLVVCIGWILFRFGDTDTIIYIIKAMFGANGNEFINFEASTIILNNIVFVMICIFAATPITKIISRRINKLMNTASINAIWVYNVINIVIPVVLLFLSTISLIGDSYNPFIYFRF